MSEDDRNEQEDHTFRIEGVDEDIMNEALKSVEKSSSHDGDASEKIAELEAQLQAKTEEAEANRDRYLRSVADLDNFRKRALREREEARQYGAENLLRDLLNVLDNMERAMEAAGEIDQIRQGVRMTHEQFKQILRQHGVEVIEAAGAPFDPARHEAVAHVESEDHSEGTVVEEHRRGYKFHDRLLRPTMVSVAKQIAAGNVPDAESESEPEPELGQSEE